MRLGTMIHVRCVLYVKLRDVTVLFFIYTNCSLYSVECSSVFCWHTRRARDMDN